MKFLFIERWVLNIFYHIFILYYTIHLKRIVTYLSFSQKYIHLWHKKSTFLSYLEIVKDVTRYMLKFYSKDTLF